MKAVSVVSKDVRSARGRAADGAGRVFAASAQFSGLLAFVLVAAMLVSAWSLTYVAGGSKTVLPHVFYVPVILASSRFRVPGAVAAALVAGLLAGPAMPQDVATGHPQEVANWLGRTAAFVVVALLVAWLTKESQGTILRRVSRSRTAAEIRAGLARGQFHVAYQPVVDLSGSRLVGFEALLRWDHPERGAVSPADFIPAAEETSAIVPLGRFVMQEALHQLAAWKATHPWLTMAVNVSPAQLGHPELVDDVRSALRAADVAAESLHIEITETAITGDVTTASSQVAALRSLGVRIAVDDFGVGQSSLSMLHQFPVDIVKIDRSFVCRITSDPKAAGMVDAIVRMAYAIGADTVGEGIESREDLDALRRLGCNLGQGFYLGRPAPASELEDRMQSWARQMALAGDPATVTHQAGGFSPVLHPVEVGRSDRHHAQAGSPRPGDPSR
jgi:EAL domain-containing protein (putative c-di-GMP-specific phosphodiesterase class I)